MTSKFKLEKQSGESKWTIFESCQLMLPKADIIYLQRTGALREDDQPYYEQSDEVTPTVGYPILLTCPDNWLRTSKVESWEEKDGSYYITTQNSVYILTKLGGSDVS